MYVVNAAQKQLEVECINGRSIYGESDVTPRLEQHRSFLLSLISVNFDCTNQRNLSERWVNKSR